MSLTAIRPAPQVAVPLPVLTQGAVSQAGVTMSVEDYLHFAQNARDKYQYYGGKAWVMSGAPYEHSAIATDTRRAFGNVFEGTTCDILDSDMRVYIPGKKAYYFPDACIVCASPQVDDHESLRNPIAIVEVLSPSTAAFDRGQKFEDYQKIESLQHYILIEQDRVSVTHYEKITGNLWAIVSLVTELSDSLNLTIDNQTVLVTLTKIYRRGFSEDNAPVSVSKVV